MSHEWHTNRRGCIGSVLNLTGHDDNVEKSALRGEQCIALQAARSPLLIRLDVYRIALIGKKGRKVDFRSKC